MTSPHTLEGRHALVTGASSGLGWQFALTLARAGAKVTLAARRTEKLEALAKEIAAFDGCGRDINACQWVCPVELCTSQIIYWTLVVHHPGFLCRQVVARQGVGRNLQSGDTCGGVLEGVPSRLLSSKSIQPAGLIYLRSPPKCHHHEV